jgi:hypothetical protein
VTIAENLVSYTTLPRAKPKAATAQCRTCKMNPYFGYGDCGGSIGLGRETLKMILRVRVSWLYERTRTNAVPHAKLGKYLRFDRDELLTWASEFRRSGRGRGLAPGKLPVGGDQPHRPDGR